MRITSKLSPIFGVVPSLKQRLGTNQQIPVRLICPTLLLLPIGPPESFNHKNQEDECGRRRAISLITGCRKSWKLGSMLWASFWQFGPDQWEFSIGEPNKSALTDSVSLGCIRSCGARAGKVAECMGPGRGGGDSNELMRLFACLFAGVCKCVSLSPADFSTPKIRPDKLHGPEWPIEQMSQKEFDEQTCHKIPIGHKREI